MRDAGEVHPPLLSAMQAALSGPGWRTPHREADHDILGRLLGTPPTAPRTEAPTGAAHASSPR
ncbi:hypothetical protein ACQ4WX_17435 [Streptomyces lasalocidi]